MKSAIENKNNFEEIAEISEKIAENSVIDGYDNIEEDSIIELNLKDFEELGSVNKNYLKSMTIIDEFENDLNEKNTLTNRYDRSVNTFNVEQLTIQIDSLTSVKKPKKIIMPVKPIVSHEVKKEKEIVKEIKEETVQEDIIQIQEKQEKPETIAGIEDGLTDDIKERYALKSDVQQILQVTEKVKELVEEIKEAKESKSTIDQISKFEINKNSHDTIIESKPDILRELKDKDVTEIAKPETATQSKGNQFTIEIPDKLFGELPANFNIDEFGQIDLNEAEIIAGEDILSLTKGNFLEELEGLNLFPEQNKEIQIKKQSIDSKTLKTQKKNIEKKETSKEESEKIEKTTKTEEVEKNEIEIVELLDVAAKPDKIENVKPEKLPTAIINKTDTAVEPAVKEKTSTDLIPNVRIKADVRSKQDTSGKKISDENVFIIDNNKLNISDAQINSSGIDELEDITSNIVDVIGGKAKQLTESEVMDRKAVTGLIRDNYPTFKDLLKDKELKDKHLYSDEDITFVDNSFITNDQTKNILESRDISEKTTKEKFTTPYEQILGLIPDEIELIENQLFNRKIDLSGTTAKKAGLDQHPSDTMTLTKYKYILPVPDSLLDDEKKSIEDDIVAENALILEEDVARIKKKLDDSMKKEITETISDITDKITIYEDNKNDKKSDENILKSNKEINKSLNYLDELFEKLPDENSTRFTETEYLDLNKKLF